jgi:DMSO/TMAO reductase YedYZ molybdopterin-dependent catalytic subunit
MKLTHRLLGITLALIVGLVACTARPEATTMPTNMTTSTPPPTSEPTSTPLPIADATSTPVPTIEATSTPLRTPEATSTPVAAKADASSLVPCVLEPVIVPTPPAQIPGYTQLDETTGLHMTGTPQEIDLESYRLEVTGKVDQPLSLTLDDLRCLPKVEASPRLVCPGFFVDEATWAGVPIREVLALAGVQEGATRLNLVSADGYATKVPLNETVTEAGFLAYEWEGEPLPILHGFPVRVVLPEISGGNWVKWLVAIEVN